MSHNSNACVLTLFGVQTTTRLDTPKNMRDGNKENGFRISSLNERERSIQGQVHATVRHNVPESRRRRRASMVMASATTAVAAETTTQHQSDGAGADAGVYIARLTRCGARVARAREQFEQCERCAH